MRKAEQWKHVFCLEGLWDSDLRENSSVLPVLELLSREYPLKYVHRDCATRTEFEFYVNKWPQKRYKEYPILYLAFHGKEHRIMLSDGNNYTLGELSENLEQKCRNRIIIFASCSTLDIDKRFIKTFIRKTASLAVCGYRTDVDWVQSVAFELLLLEAMQDNEFSRRGIESIENRLNELGKMFRHLEFRIVTQKEL